MNKNILEIESRSWVQVVQDTQGYQMQSFGFEAWAETRVVKATNKRKRKPKDETNEPINTLQKELPVVCPRAHSALTSVPGSRDAPCRETNLRSRHLKSLPRKSTKFLLICRYSSAISALGNQYATRKL